MKKEKKLTIIWFHSLISALDNEGPEVQRFIDGDFGRVLRLAEITPSIQMDHQHGWRSNKPVFDMSTVLDPTCTAPLKLMVAVSRHRLRESPPWSQCCLR